MAFDELGRLSGSTNNPLETITANGNGTGILAGKQRLIEAELRVGAATGTSPTLDIYLEESTTAAGTYTEVGSGASSGSNTGAKFPQQTAGMAERDVANVLTVGISPARISFITAKDYVRMRKVVGGTSPSFTSVSVELINPRGGVALG